MYKSLNEYIDNYKDCFSFVCRKCWEDYKNCKCSTKKGVVSIDGYCVHDNIIEIDSIIADSIKMLNKKGYKTNYCCAGHLDKKVFCFYITFANKIDFTVPAFFNVEANINTIRFARYPNNMTIKEACELYMQFDKWVDSLPVRND